jgi:hypothetical protein
MDKEKLHFVVSYKKMKARLLYGESMMESEVVREFELNKGNVGILVDRFYWTHKGDTSSTRHDIIADLGKPEKGLPRKPFIQIYPLIGVNVVSKDPIYASYVQGSYDDYLANHKHYEHQKV